MRIMINFGWEKDETEQIMILHNYMALEIRNFNLFNKISDTKIETENKIVQNKLNLMISTKQ